MKNLLERAINLAKITKDNVIVADENNNEGYVIMDLARYERLVSENPIEERQKSLTDRELIDKINRDIACSQEKQENEVLERDQTLEKLEELPKMEASFSDDEEFDEDEEDEDENKNELEENMYYYSENKDIINDNTFSFKADFVDDKDEGNGWKIPTEIKRGAEEVDQ